MPNGESEKIEVTRGALIAKPIPEDHIDLVAMSRMGVLSDIQKYFPDMKESDLDGILAKKARDVSINVQDPYVRSIVCGDKSLINPLWKVEFVANKDYMNKTDIFQTERKPMAVCITRNDDPFASFCIDASSKNDIGYINTIFRSINSHPLNLNKRKYKIDACNMPLSVYFNSKKYYVEDIYTYTDTGKLMCNTFLSLTENIFSDGGDSVTVDIFSHQLQFIMKGEKENAK